MIGPKVLISILETRYRENDMLFEATGPRPRRPGGRRQRNRSALERDIERAKNVPGAKHQDKLEELFDALQIGKENNIPGAKIYRAWVLRHGEQVATEAGLPPPPRGTPQGDEFHSLIDADKARGAQEFFRSETGWPFKKPSTPSSKPSTTPKTEPTPEPTPEPRTEPRTPPSKPQSSRRQPRTEKPESVQGEVIVPERKPFRGLEIPETHPIIVRGEPITPKSTGAIVPATTERFPKPVGEPDTTALARRRTDIQKARETGKYPLEKYRGGTPVEITPPPPPPPPSPTLPKPSDRELAPGRDEFTSFSLPQQGAYYAYDVGIVRDIPGMARLAHQWRIA